MRNTGNSVVSVCDSSVLLPVGHEMFSCSQSAFNDIRASQGEAETKIWSTKWRFTVQLSSLSPVIMTICAINSCYQVEAVQMEVAALQECKLRLGEDVLFIT